MSDMGRTIGVEEARGKLGQLVDEVNRTREPITITKRGLTSGVLISRDEYARLLLAASRLAREDLAARLAETRRAVAEAGIDPSEVDQAIEEVRKLR